MRQLEDEGIQREITDIWNKLGPEGEGEELKLAAQHCLLGVQEILSHTNDYTVLTHIAETFRTHPQYDSFQAFRKEIESGKYQVHFSLDKIRHSDGGRAVYLSTRVERTDHKAIPPQVRQNIEGWASTVGFDALETDIERMLNLLEHAQPVSSQLFSSSELATANVAKKGGKTPKP